MKQSGFGIASLILGIIGILTLCIVLGIVPAILSIVFGIIAIANKDNKKALPIIGIVLSSIAIIGSVFVAIFALSDTNNDKSNTEEITTEITTTKEETTEEKTTEMSEEDFKEAAQEVTYEDIYRNPETYKGKPIKITVYIEEYDTQYLGFVDVYYCTMEGNDIFLTDTRSIQEPTIVAGDTVVIYGKGNGLATLAEK